jgi:hypothetical protein
MLQTIIDQLNRNIENKTECDWDYLNRYKFSNGLGFPQIQI